MSGPFGSSQWMYASGGFYNGVATQSLRFDDGSSAYLSRTPSSAGNRKTWTWSGWIKRCELGVAQYGLISYGNSSGSWGGLNINSADVLMWTTNANNSVIGTTAKFRDVSSWYHVVLAVDTTQSTEADRIKFYVNGDFVSSSALAGSYPTQNSDTLANTTTQHRVGGMFDGGTNFQYDGYISELNFIDGQALDPTSFGETKNGVWIAKEYTGSYGTNGFRLQFNQTGTGSASSSTIGADTSGNANHFSSSGIVASDCDMTDSPENNFATICPLSSGAGVFSEGNLKYVSTTDTGNGTFGISSGKAYLEVYVSGGSNYYVGVLDIRNLSPTRGGNWINHGAIAYKGNGDQYSLPIGGSSATASYGASYTTGDIIGIAFDVDADTVTFYKNGSSQGNTTNGLSHISSNGVYSFLIYGDNSTYIINTGQDSTFAGATTAGGNADANGIGDFKYSVPSGYLALCTANLPEPTISPNADTQADDYFNTVTYTGTGASGNAITGVGFQPDWLWIKRRNGATSHRLIDSNRGSGFYLSSDTSNSEDSTSGIFTSFDSDGFTVEGTANSTNGSGQTYVAWNWKAGGTAVSNTDGSITSSVSANTDAGFSIVTYTGTGANATVGHGLNVAPNFMIIKSRDSAVQDWTVYSEEIGNTKNMALNTSGAEETATTNFNSTSPTSTVFSIGTRFETNESGAGFVAYCFHDVDGYSKFGSYTGNGSADGTFVYLGFRPAFIIIKQTNTTNNWIMMDNKRGNINPDLGWLYPDDPSAEDTGSSRYTDFVSNGMKIRNGGTGMNTSGGTYIYMAFAENPFKYANAR